jgi:hypothetical protein|tara:strand:+ start:888 stop:1160 length:273 start_codon:yes stop_codon:yes gene_type:complete
MKNILYTILLCLLVLKSHASEWEYKVVFLAGNATGTKVTFEASGAYLDSAKTNVLNNLGLEGWELIAVTGASGADHALYLKRSKNNQVKK